MDVSGAKSRMECPKTTTGVLCPGGPDMALSVFTDGTMYTVDHNGTCVAKPCPSCGDPRGLPFSFLIIDGANGDASRGTATFQGQVEVDGTMMDHFSHDRGTIKPGFGVMNWYLVGNDLMRNSYVEDKSSPQNPGGSGSRDFSGAQKLGGKGTRVEPAPKSSFAMPEGCKKPLATYAWESAFGDYYYKK